MKQDRLYIAHNLECILRIESYTRDGWDNSIKVPYYKICLHVKIRSEINELYFSAA